MPKSTFFKISEEKQKRILNAAREQFWSVPYNEVSINKIIKQAEIPRGSFYQYFDGKEDLFQCVLEENKSNLLGRLSDEIEKADGDIFRCMESHIDRMVHFVYHDNSKKIQMLFSEPWIFETILMGIVKEESSDHNVPCRLLDKIDRSRLDIRDEDELAVIVSILSAVVRDCICKTVIRREKNSEEEARKIFKAKLDSLKRHYSK